MINVAHNPAIFEYRNPIGALKTEKSTLLKLAVFEGSPQSAHLCIIDENGTQELLMKKGEGGFMLSLPPYQKEGVVWYYFRVRTAEGKELYYGAKPGVREGWGMLGEDPPIPFQITIYNKDFKVPEWFIGSTMYQIFPDRFARGDTQNFEYAKAYHKRMGRKIYEHKDWSEEPLSKPLEGEKYYSPCDFFGGDLKGIENHMDYFKELGVDVIYLNPVAESASNHRYDTADYKCMDPMLGTNEDFTRLCVKGLKKGIRIMADGVFSHTGSDSIYFNKLGNFQSVGAYQGEKSPFYSWYTFYKDREGYRSWWGFDTLPEVNKQDKSWQEFVITGEKSVINHWLSLGASGFRLDVADELPDEIIELMRSSVKGENTDNILLGEVWEDATIKESYGRKRRYALGSSLDSVMNYPFTNGVLDFLKGEIPSYRLKDILQTQRCVYPKQMYYSLMNLLSSHDVARAATVLGCKVDIDKMDRDEQGAFKITEEMKEEGYRLMRLAVVLQFTNPGVPSIYYGDEQGMHGMKDPFNRGTFQMTGEREFNLHKRVSSLRKREDAFRVGGVAFLAPDNDVFGNIRFVTRGRDALGGSSANSFYLTLVNRGGGQKNITINLYDIKEGLTQKERAGILETKFTEGLDLMNEVYYDVKDGIISLIIEGQDCVIIRIK